MGFEHAPKAKTVPKLYGRPDKVLVKEASVSHTLFIQYVFSVCADDGSGLVKSGAVSSTR